MGKRGECSKKIAKVSWKSKKIQKDLSKWKEEWGDSWEYMVRVKNHETLKEEFKITAATETIQLTEKLKQIGEKAKETKETEDYEEENYILRELAFRTGKELEKTESERKRWEESANVLEKESVNHNKEKHKLWLKVEELRRELTLVKGKQGEREENEKYWVNLETQLGEAKIQIEKLKKNLVEEQKKIKQMEKETESQLSEKERELVEEKNKVEELMDYFELAKKKIEDLQNESKNEKEDHEITKRELSELEKDLKKQLEEIARLKRLEQKEKEKFEKGIKKYEELKRQNDELTEINERLGTNMKKINLKNWDLSWENKNLEKQIGDENLLESPPSLHSPSLGEELKKVEVERINEELQEELKTATSKIAEIEESKNKKLTKLKDKYQAKNKQIRQLSKKLVLAEVKFNNSQNNSSRLSDKLSQKDQELQNLNSRVKKVNRELEQVRTEKGQLTIKLNRTEKENENLTEQKKQTEEQNKMLTKQAKEIERLKKQLVKLQAENKENYSKFKAEKKTHQRTIREQEKKDLLEQQINEYSKSKLTAKQTQIEDLIQTNQQLHQQVKDLKNSTVEKEENDRLIKEQEQLKNSLDARAAEIREEAVQKLEQTRQKEAQLAQEKIEQLTDQLTAEKDKLTERLLGKIGKLTREQAKNKKWAKAQNASIKLIQVGNRSRDKLRADLWEAQRKIDLLESEKKDLEANQEILRDIKKELRDKLRKIKEAQLTQAQKAEAANLCRDLILYRNISDDFENPTDRSLEVALTQSTDGLINIIVQTQNHLGVADLTQLMTAYQMPEGKSLGDLINFYNNPPQNNLNYHVCPPTCSETYHQQLQQAVVEELNTHLGLGLEEPNLNQMVNHLTELLRKPLRGAKPANQPVSTIIKQGEDLEKIKQTSLRFLEQIFSTIPQETKEYIRSARNYQEVAQIEKKLIQARLGQQAQTNQVLQVKNEHLNYWRWGLIILLIFKSFIIVGLVIKLTKANKTKRLK